MYGLQVSKLIVIRVNTHAKEEAGIATVYNLVIPELDETRQLFKDKRPQNQRRIAYLDKIGLIFLIARRNYPMHFSTQTELYWKLECTRLMENPRESTFSSSSYGTYHFDNRVLP
jgi:hypothetical protein